MSGDVVTDDGRVYVVTFDGAHRECDADLLRPIDWTDQKSPWVHTARSPHAPERTHRNRQAEGKNRSRRYFRKAEWAALRAKREAA